MFKKACAASEQREGGRVVIIVNLKFILEWIYSEQKTLVF